RQEPRPPDSLSQFALGKLVCPQVVRASSGKLAIVNSRFKLLLYLICGLTDFAAFVVIFAVSRGLAEGQAESWYLGVVGAGLSFSAGVGSILGGWLAHRCDGRIVFVSGAVTIGASIGACAVGDPTQLWFLPGYWLLGIGLGCIYPPLVGWLNQGVDAHANRHGVSRTLILFCVAWNLGMMCGQLTAGSLFAWGANWTYGTAFSVSMLNLILAFAAARRVVPLCEVSNDRTPAEHDAIELAAAFKRLSWVANLGGMFGGSMVIHLLPDLAVAIGVPPDDHGKLLASWRLVVIATYLVMHHVTFWHYRLSTALASQLLAAVGLIVIARAESAVTLLAGLTLLGQLVGYNYFSGLFYSTAGSSHERRALAAGIHEATLAVGMSIGTIVGGVLGTLVNQRVPYLLAAAVLLVMIVVQSVAWWRWVRSRRRTKPATTVEPSALIRDSDSAVPVLHHESAQEEPT
ncbi:MAG: MFS transporter, partial [Planctomycetota bacterium]|nr:MFS transporter [Planctomycetota bacterium]